jgi:hypothetical protein
MVIDPMVLIEALSSIKHYGTSSNKTAVGYLTKAKLCGPTGKLTEAGDAMIEDWYASGSDRIGILKRLTC